MRLPRDNKPPRDANRSYNIRGKQPRERQKRTRGEERRAPGLRVGLLEGEYAVAWEGLQAPPIPAQAPVQPEQELEGLPRPRNDRRVGLQEEQGPIGVGAGHNICCMI